MKKLFFVLLICLLFLGGCIKTTGIKDCGVLRVDNFEDEKAKTSSEFACFNQAMINCTPAKIALFDGNDTLKYEIKSQDGENCITEIQKNNEQSTVISAMRTIDERNVVPIEETQKFARQ